MLGAGELGLPVLRNLARLAKRTPGSTISVLLRDSTINTQVPEKKVEIDELRGLGIQMVAADLVNDSIDQLAEVFARFDTVIGCAGMVAGRETPEPLICKAWGRQPPSIAPNFQAPGVRWQKKNGRE